MEKINYSIISLSVQCRFKLSQVLFMIYKLHGYKVDVLLKHQLDKQLEYIYSEYRELNHSLDELTASLLKSKNSKQKIRSLILFVILKLVISKSSLVLYLIPAILLRLVFKQYSDNRQIIFKLSNFLLSEDAQSVLEVLIKRESRNNRSPLRRKIVMFYLFFDVLWGNRIIPYFQNKFLPGKKELD